MIRGEVLRVAFQAAADVLNEQRIPTSEGKHWTVADVRAAVKDGLARRRVLREIKLLRLKHALLNLKRSIDGLGG